MKWTRAHGLGAALLVSLLVLLLALAAAALASQQAVQRLAASGDALQRSQQVLTTLATLQLAAADGTADTDAAALAQARAHADAQMAMLRDLLSHDPAQYSRLVTVGPLLAQRFDAPAATEPRRRALAAGPVDQRAQQARAQTAVQAAVQALVGPAQQAFDANRRQHDEAAASARHWALWSGSAALLVVAALAAAGWKLLRLLDQQRAGAQAARQEQQRAASDLQHVLTASPAPLCVLDADGRFLRSNPACAALWGRDADALRGTPLLDGVAPDDRRRTQLALDQLLAGAALPEFRHRVQRADGSTVLLAWQATWSAADRTLACAGHDITELEALRQQAAQHALALQQGQQALAVARAQADEADALKTLFLSMLGQTLRTPLDHVDSMADVLLRGLSGPLAPAQQRELQQLRASAQQVRATVLDMLDLARIEAGAVQLRHEPFDMAEAIHKVAAVARQQAQDKGVQLQLQLADDLDYARGDERRFEQALGKLLDNAVRFTSAGSITLRATAEPAGQLQISITDTGIGIAADDMARLYQPFRPLGTSGAEARAKSTGPGETRGHQGVGLGLAIAQRLAVLMGGSIHASSQPQQGSTFTLRLPADTAANVGTFANHCNAGARLKQRGACLIGLAGLGSKPAAHLRRCPGRRCRFNQPAAGEHPMKTASISTSAIALAAVAALAGCANMNMAPMAAVYAQDALPDAVKVPAGFKVALETVGKGDITYECRIKATVAGEYEWFFVGPSATLMDRSGKAVGKYYGPPATWEAMDGSKVTGTQLAVAPAGMGNIPSQLVKANPATGMGAMAGISHIQRVATRGGVAPAMPCANANLGQKQVVSYQADYIFYKAM